MRIPLMVFALGFVFSMSVCQAQQQLRPLTAAGGFGTAGTGASSFGSSAAPSTGMFGARTLGSSQTPGNRSFAGGGASTRAGVQQLRPGQDVGTAGVGEVSATDRFTRTGRRPGQFVGADTTDLPSFLTQLAGVTGTGTNAAMQLRGRTQQGRGQNANNPNQQATRGTGGRMSQQQAQYRVSRSVGFNYMLPSSAQLRTQLGSRLQRLPGVSALGPIDVTLQERTVVLRGSVATAHDRDLAERLALLEAGVDQVQNELTIAPPATTAPPAALPAATSAARPAGSSAN